MIDCSHFCFSLEWESVEDGQRSVVIFGVGILKKKSRRDTRKAMDVELKMDREPVPSVLER